MRSRAKVALISAVGGSTIIPNSGATVEILTLDEWQRVRLPTFVLGERLAYSLYSCSRNSRTQCVIGSRS